METITASGLRKFANKKEYKTQLIQYCNEHHYTYEVPGDNSKEALATKRGMESLWKMTLNTKGEVSVETIGIDPEDTKRFMIVWAEDYSNVLINTYCSALTGDYNQEVIAFCKDFFKATTVSEPEAMNFSSMTK